MRAFVADRCHNVARNFGERKNVLKPSRAQGEERASSELWGKQWKILFFRDGGTEEVRVRHKPVEGRESTGERSKTSRGRRRAGRSK